MNFVLFRFSCFFSFFRNNLIAFYDNSDPTGKNYYSKWANKNIIITGTCNGQTKTFDAVVADTCSNSDCSNCCSKNSDKVTGYLIDLEYYTMKRVFGENAECGGSLSFTVDTASSQVVPTCGSQGGGNECTGNQQCCSADGFCGMGESFVEQVVKKDMVPVLQTLVRADRLMDNLVLQDNAAVSMVTVVQGVVVVERVVSRRMVIVLFLQLYILLHRRFRLQFLLRQPFLLQQLPRLIHLQPQKLQQKSQHEVQQLHQLRTVLPAILLQ
jgi:hypothetical protein